jgi:hypothetical protein
MTTEIIMNARLRGDIERAGGYAAILGNKKVLTELQDGLDDLIAGRVIEVRNALRSLGWSGAPQLEKDGVEADFKFDHIGGGANLYGYCVNGQRDMLDRSAHKFAAEINDLAVLATLGGERITEGPFSGFSLVPQSTYGVNTSVLNVWNTQGRVIGYIRGELKYTFIAGNVSGFKPVSNWRTTYSQDLIEKMGLSQNIPPEGSILFLPRNEKRPESICVIEDSGQFLVMSNRGKGWITQAEHPDVDKAISDARGWYPDQQEYVEEEGAVAGPGM